MKRLFALLLAVLVMAPIVAAYGVTFYNPAWNPQDGKIFDVVEADKPYVFEVRKDDIAIRKITFIINRDAQNAGVTVYHLKSVPSFLPEVPENDSYEFNEIKYSGFVPHDTTKFIYEFQVAKSWLEDKKVPRTAMALHAYDSTLEVWHVLPTEVRSDDDEFVYFSASDDEGVHHLFIGRAQSGEKADLTAPVEEVEAPAKPETPAAELGSEVTPVQLDAPPAPVAQPVAPSQPSQPAPASAPSETEDVDDSSDSALIGVLILLALVVIVVILYLMFGRKKLGYSVDKELKNYIDESLKRGKTKEEVRNRLLEVGWHHERVDKALGRYKGSEPKKESKPEHKGSMSMAEAKALAERQTRDAGGKPAHKHPAAKSKKK